MEIIFGIFAHMLSLRIIGLRVQNSIGDKTVGYVQIPWTAKLVCSGGVLYMIIK